VTTPTTIGFMLPKADHFAFVDDCGCFRFSGAARSIA